MSSRRCPASSRSARCPRPCPHPPRPRRRLALRSPPKTTCVVPAPADQQRRRHGPPPEAATIASKPFLKDLKKYLEWKSVTTNFAGAANIPFLPLHLPQIVLNARNLLAGNKTALFAAPWLGMLTGMLGNLSLLSYFAKKRETEAVNCHRADFGRYLHLCCPGAARHGGVHACAAVRGHINLCGCAGLILDFLNYLGGSLEPSGCSGRISSQLVALLSSLRQGWADFQMLGLKFVGSLSGWTATLLFMWMPVAQMVFKLVHRFCLGICPTRLG